MDLDVSTVGAIWQFLLEAAFVGCLFGTLTVALTAWYPRRK